MTDMKQQKLWIVLGALFLVMGLAGLVMERFSLPGFTLNAEDRVFLDGHGLSYEEAQSLYRQAGEDLKENRLSDAIDKYNRLQPSYSRLRPMIMLHLAEAYSESAQEGKTQEILGKLSKAYPQTPFAGIAQYKLGQSYVRTHQQDPAKKAFETVLTLSPNSAVAIGSRYYLGELARMSGDSAEAAEQWREYLRQAPKGTFSSLAADGLQNHVSEKTLQDHHLIGTALFYQDKWAQALPYLEKSPFNQAWVLLGTSYLKTGNTAKGTEILQKGLFMKGPADQAEMAIDAILQAVGNATQQRAKLEQLWKWHPKAGGDYVLWKLQKLTEGPARLRYAQALLDYYPQSNWAPETSWALMWPLYEPGNAAKMSAFLTRADNHLKRYPTSNSAPRVLFWKAKAFLASGKSGIADALLQDLAEQYPRNYYGFRAQQLLSHVANPWKTFPENPYPPKEERLALEAQAISQYIDDDSLRPVVAELINTESPDDVAYLLQSQYVNQAPPVLESVVHHQRQEYAQSIRIVRDYLDDRRKAGKPDSTNCALKLLYPVLYTDAIQQYAQKNRLDPYLVQALMRQESYFNPFAVSSSRAMGLMQLLPSTAQGVAEWEGVAGFNAPMLFNPDTNIRFGIRYLRYLHDRFKGNSMQSVGGYNGGPGAMSRWVTGSPYTQSDPDRFIESIPYGQSRDYIKEVYSHYWNYLQLYKS